MDKAHRGKPLQGLSAQKGRSLNEPLDEEVFEVIDENFFPEEYAEASEKREIVMRIMREVLSDCFFRQ